MNACRVDNFCRDLKLAARFLIAPPSNPLEGFVISLFAKEARPSVAAVQGMVESVGFVGAWRSGHDDILPSIK